MAEIGWASLGIIPSFDGFGRELEKGSSKHLAAAGVTGGQQFGDAAGKSAGRRFGGVFSKAAKASMLGLAGAGALAVKIGKDAVGEASDLNESLNAVNLTYGRQSRAVKKLGREAADSLGLSNTQFNAMSVRFAAFSKTIAGGDGKKVVGTLDDLTTRASDFASVMNLEVNEAAELFQSGLAGETEPLRRFGLDLSAAAVEAHAFATGIATGKGELTEAEKIQARYSLLMQQTSKTQGDFANTSDELANRQRIVNARWDDAQAKLGKGLLPLMTDLSGWVLEDGLPAFEDFANWFTNKGIPAIGNFADDVRPLAKEALPAMGDALGTVRDVLKPAAKHAVDLVGAFNDMPDWAKTAIVGGGGGLLVGKKLGLGKLAGKAGGSLVGKATPVPVIVMNKGFGADGVPDGGGGKGGKLGKLGKWAPGLGALGTGALGASAAAVAGGGALLEWGEPLAGTGKVPGKAIGILRDMFEDTKKAGDEADRTRKKYNNLHHDLTRRIKLAVDNSSVKQAQEEMRRLINLANMANSIDVRLQGAQGAHNAKLAGDAYNFNFNGVDMAGAKREMRHARRAAAMGGADFQ